MQCYLISNITRNPRPNSNEKGVYTLKEEYLNSYSPYFYHYVKSEKTKSEEQQLSLKTNPNEKFFKPSALPKLRTTFNRIENLLDSEVLIQICFTVLNRCLSKSKYFSDGQLAKVLHLIGLALHKEKQDIDANIKNKIKLYEFKFLEKTVQEKTDNNNLIELINKVVAAVTTNQYKLLSQWILEYAQSLKDQKFATQVESSELSQGGSEQTESVGSESTSGPRRSGSPEDGGIGKEKRKNLLAEKRRAKILAQLNKQQKNFIQNNKVSG